MKDNKLLLIFIKNPKKGTVKTRLAKTVGDEKAYETYLKLVDHTMGVAANVDAQKQIWYSSFIDESDGYGEKPPARSKQSESHDMRFEKKLQQGDNLGERMSHAFMEGFGDGFSKVLIIGSDCPAISPEIIEDGFDKLGEADVVVGPSEDGGYYLIGMKTFIPEIFNGIPWSTEKVYPETIRVLKKNQMSYRTLPTLNDIDTEEDLRKSKFE